MSLPIDETLDRLAAELVAGGSRRDAAERAGVPESAVSYMLERDSFRKLLRQHAASAGVDLAELPAVSGHPRVERIVDPMLGWLVKGGIYAITWGVIIFVVFTVIVIIALPFVDKSDWVP